MNKKRIVKKIINNMYNIKERIQIFLYKCLGGFYLSIIPSMLFGELCEKVQLLMIHEDSINSIWLRNTRFLTVQLYMLDMWASDICLLKHPHIEAILYAIKKDKIIGGFYHDEIKKTIDAMSSDTQIELIKNDINNIKYITKPTPYVKSIYNKLYIMRNACE